MTEFPLLFLGVLIGSGSQLLLKAGMNRIGTFQFTLANLWPVFWQVSASPYIILGTLGFVLGLVIWLMVLSRTEISVAYPMMSIGYIITSVGAYYFFQENLSPLRIAGIVSIMFGVYLISRSA